MLVLSWLVVSAWAAPPTKAPADAAFDGGSNAPVQRLAISSDDAIVTGIVDKRVILVDALGWKSAISDENEEEAPCDATSALAVPRDGGGWYVFVGCREARILTFRWNNDRFVAHGPDATAPAARIAPPESDTGGFRASAQYVVEDLGGEVVGLFESPGEEGVLYALVKDGNQMRGRRFTHAGGQLTRDTAYTANLPQGFVEAVPNAERTQVVTWHDGADFSNWTLASGLVILPAFPIFRPDVVDIASREGTGAYFADHANGRIGYYTGGGEQTALVSFAAEVDDVDAVCRTYRDPEPVFVTMAGNEVSLWTGDSTGTGLELGERFMVDFRAADMIEGPPGYVLVGTRDGEVRVLTANPWISDVTISPPAALAGTEVTVTFSVDEPATVRLRRDRRDGPVLADAVVSEAGPVSLRFTVESGIDEGAHQVWVEAVAAGDPDRVGYARTRFTVDNPPSGVRILDAGFAPRAVVLTLQRVSDADIRGYRVYIDDEPFTEADFPSGGGPEGEVPGGAISPIDVPQPETGSEVTVRISPLKNGVTYWVAARAYDASAEGPMSEVVSVTPEGTVRPCDVAFDGECPRSDCALATSPVTWLGWLPLLGIAAAVRRRPAAAATLLAAGVALSAPAHAQPEDEPRSPVLARDITPAWANFEFHAGAFRWRDDVFESFYGDTAPDLRFEIGGQFFRYAELDFGIGYVWDKGHTLGRSTGRRSAEEVRMQLLPLMVQVVGRVHVLDEQPIVPYAAIGGDLVFYREDVLDEDGRAVKSQRSNGSRLGWHWAVGGNLLLDLFAPRRASQLEATTGINDTWLVIEFRRQYVNPNGDGFDLSGWTLSGGLKLDY